MTVFRIYRIRKGNKTLRRPELMHNHIEARNAASALQRYHTINPAANIHDLEAKAA